MAGQRPDAVAWAPGGTDAEAVRSLYERLAAPGGAPLLLAPTRDDFAAARARIERPLAGVDVIIRTSGSSDGRGRLVGLGRDALTASARATLARLGGPGQWVTSLPVDAVAGFQVVLRSTLAGLPPVVPAAGPLDRGRLSDALARLAPGTRRYLSLVPTQLHRAIETCGDLLAAFDAVLVGGAALPEALAARARAQGVRVVTTYGSTETSGGCVYDGVPLDGVRVRLVDGLVHVGGPTLATGYLDAGVQPFVSDTEGRWLATHDRAEWVDGRLVVRGRADDVIISGGVNVDPRPVEEALAALGGEWVVVGVPDAEWGHRVVAVGTHPASLDTVRAATAHLRPAERPRAVVVIDALPLRPTGKVDRRAVSGLAGAASDR